MEDQPNAIVDLQKQVVKLQEQQQLVDRFKRFLALGATFATLLGVLFVYLQFVAIPHAVAEAMEGKAVKEAEAAAEKAANQAKKSAKRAKDDATATSKSAQVAEDAANNARSFGIKMDRDGNLVCKSVEAQKITVVVAENNPDSGSLIVSDPKTHTRVELQATATHAHVATKTGTGFFGARLAADLGTETRPPQAEMVVTTSNNGASIANRVVEPAGENPGAELRLRGTGLKEFLENGLPKSNK